MNFLHSFFPSEFLWRSLDFGTIAIAIEIELRSAFLFYLFVSMAFLLWYTWGAYDLTLAVFCAFINIDIENFERRLNFNFEAMIV
jgi:hypothetical protein